VNEDYSKDLKVAVGMDRSLSGSRRRNVVPPPTIEEKNNNNNCLT